MAVFTTRIEIFGTRAVGHYQQLDGIMQAAGFFRILQLTSKGAINELPAGYYNHISYTNSSDVLEAAINATRRIDKKVRITIYNANDIKEVA